MSTEIDLGDGGVTVKFKGVVHTLREPTMDDVDKFQAEAKKAVDAGEEADGRFIEKFLQELGMPEEVVKQMGLITQRRFLDQLMKPITEKK